MEFGYCVPFLGWDPATRAPPGRSLSLSFSRLLDLLSDLLSSPSSYNLETWSFCSCSLRLKLVGFLPVSEAEEVRYPKNLFDMNHCSRGSCFQSSVQNKRPYPPALLFYLFPLLRTQSIQDKICEYLGSNVIFASTYNECSLVR